MQCFVFAKNIFKISTKKIDVKNYTVVMCVNTIKELCELENLLQFMQQCKKINKLCNECHTVLQINYQNSFVHSTLSNLNCL